jgi:hypothetical protein
LNAIYREKCLIRFNPLADGVFLYIRVMSRQQWQELAALDSLFYRNLKRDGVSLLPEQV